MPDKYLLPEQIVRLKAYNIVRPQRTAILLSMYSGIVGNSLLSLQKSDLSEKNGAIAIKKDQYKTIVIDPHAHQEIKIYVESIGSENLFNFQLPYYKTYLNRLSEALKFSITQTILQNTFFHHWAMINGDSNTLSMMMGREVDVIY